MRKRGPMKKIFFLLCVFLFFPVPFSLSADNTDPPEASRYLWKDLSVNLPEPELKTFAADPQNSNRLFAAGRRGVWKTENGGIHWKKVFSVTGKTYLQEGEIQEKEANDLFLFLDRDNQERLLKAENFVSEIARLLFEETEFSGASDLAIHPSNENLVFLGTFDGLYLTRNGGLDWERVRLGIGNEEQAVLFVKVSRHDEDKIFAGTLGGLFVSKNKGKRWRPFKRGIGNEIVTDLEEDFHNPKIIWGATTSNGILFTSNGGKRWETQKLGVGEASNRVRDLSLLQAGLDSFVFAVTDGGLYCRKPNKPVWEAVRQASFPGRKLNRIETGREGEPSLYLTGENGVYLSKDNGKTFAPLTLGFRFRQAQKISVDQNQKITFLTPQGIYQSRSRKKNIFEEPQITEEMLKQAENKLWKKFRSEPSVQEVQSQAVRFAQTHPEMIKKWKQGARLRALLPKLQLGYDEDRDRRKTSQIQVSDEFGFSEEFKQDEDVITASSFKGKRQIPVRTFTEDFFREQLSEFEEGDYKDRETGFVIGAVWELSDLIYNPDEIGISKEARSLAELRDDILKEVTQYYFRRRHLQFDMLLDQAPKPENLDPEAGRKALEKRIRIKVELEELTAQLDGLTGGWFSKEAKRRKEKINLL